MRCVKEDGKYICEGVTSSCCFFSENCRNTRTICNSLDAHLWATDIAKIEELTKLAQDRGDDLDNANELLTIAEEKVKKQAAEIERLRAATEAFGGAVLSVRRHNTGEWMEYIGEETGGATC